MVYALRSCAAWKNGHAHPQGQALAVVPPIELARFGDSKAIPFKPAAWRPLQGLRVLDFSHVLASPTIGKLLAEHGADVIHCRYPYLDHILGFDIETRSARRIPIWTSATQATATSRCGWCASATSSSRASAGNRLRVMVSGPMTYAASIPTSSTLN